MENQPREIQLAWLAGLFDGEGNITNGTPSKPNVVRLRIVLESRDKFVLELVQKIAGGNLYHRKVQKSWRPNCSDQWEWQVSSRLDVYKLLLELKPYLILKKSRAVEALSKIEGLLQ